MKKKSDSDKLAQLQKDFNSLKAESNKEISELKKERRALKAKITSLNDKLSSYVNIIPQEDKNLKEEYRKVVQELNEATKSVEALTYENKEYKSSESELKDKIYYLKKELSCYKDEPEKINRGLLIEFHGPTLFERKNEEPFFSNTDLITRINPATGNPITVEEHERAIKFLNGMNQKKFYEECKKKIFEYKNGRLKQPHHRKSTLFPNRIEPNWFYPDLEYFDDICRQLLKRYSHIFY